MDISQCNRALKGLIVSLRIDETDLIGLLDKLLQQSKGQRRFAAPRGTSDQYIGAVRLEEDLLILLTRAQQQDMSADALIQGLQVIGEQLLDQLNHAIATVSLRCIIRLLFERG